MASGRRLESETYDEYRKRLKTEEIKTKIKLQGNVVWHGSQGTYRKSEVK